MVGTGAIAQETMTAGDRYGWAMQTHAGERGEYRHHGRRGGKHMRSEMRSPAQGALRHQADLKLTDEQIDKLEESAKQTRRELVQLQADIRVQRMDLRDATQEYDFDPAQVQQQQATVQSLQQQMAQLRLTELTTVRETLTPEQWEQLNDLRGNSMRMMRRHH
jgi:Spy/CpxP family protein refolding chaperone